MSNLCVFVRAGVYGFRVNETAETSVAGYRKFDNTVVCMRLPSVSVCVTETRMTSTPIAKKLEHCVKGI